jgi:hypothetical protein
MSPNVLGAAGRWCKVTFRVVGGFLLFGKCLSCRMFIVDPITETLLAEDPRRNRIVFPVPPIAGGNIQSRDGAAMFSDGHERRLCVACRARAGRGSVALLVSCLGFGISIEFFFRVSIVREGISSFCTDAAFFCSLGPGTPRRVVKHLARRLSSVWM